MLTQKELKELIHYDPETGLFKWIKSRQGVSKGNIAGTKNKRGYIQITINYKVHRAHKLAWLYITGEYPKHQIDHVNHNPSDNRFINLRDVSHIENNRNKSRAKNNTSGITGIHLVMSRKKWAAQIKVNNKSINLGRYSDKFEAICARKSAEAKYGFHENHGK